MNAFTHFQIKNLKQLEEAYREFDDQFDLTFEEAKHQFLKGKKTLECDSIGIVYLTETANTNSTKISNPFSDTVDEEKTPPVISGLSLSSIKKKKDLQNEQQTDQRRKRIDAYLRAIQLDLDPNHVTKMLTIVDLDAQHDGAVPFNQILQLAD